jgi:hypothetical protein
MIHKWNNLSVLYAGLIPLKLCTLQDPNMKMCTLVVYPGPSSFPRILSLKVVFQICFGSIKMMGMEGIRQ